MNVVAESASRFLSFAGGLASTILLYRAIGMGSWTQVDYAATKVLTNASQALLPIILLGLAGALSRVVASYSSDRKRLGEAVGSSVLTITLAYVVIMLVIVVFSLDQVLIDPGQVAGLEAASLRLYWILVIVSILPISYLRIAKQVFSGMQQTRRILYVDIIYNALRIILLVFFFFQNLVTIFNILLLNLTLVLIAASMALVFLAREMKRNEIPWGFKPSPEVVSSISRLAAVYLVATLVSANLNNLTVLWVWEFGSPADVAHFSIAKGIIQTLSQILSGPVVATKAFLTMEYIGGTSQSFKAKFKTTYRMMIPAFAFVTAATSAFGTPLLRVLYGADGIGAAPFLQLLAFNLLFISLPGLFDLLYIIADDVRGLFYSSLVQIAFQNVWLFVMAPLIGVTAMVTLWIPYIPFFFLQQAYTKRKHQMGIDQKTVWTNVALGLVFLFGMFLLVPYLYALVGILSMIGIVEAGIVALFAIPLWYLFIACATGAGLLSAEELDNYERVLRVFPPAWWISKPIVTRIKKLVGPKEDDNVLDAETAS